MYVLVLNFWCSYNNKTGSLCAVTVFCFYLLTKAVGDWWKLNEQIQLTRLGHSTCTSTTESPMRGVTETIGVSGAKKRDGKK